MIMIIRGMILSPSPAQATGWQRPLRPEAPPVVLPDCRAVHEWWPSLVSPSESSCVTDLSGALGRLRAREYY
jgi:predicted component of type VI protein secretion system